MRRRWLTLLIIALAACSSKPPAPVTSATLVGTGFSVVVVADPFSVKILDLKGVAKLSTASGPRFTFDEHVFEAQIIPGWDGYVAHERPWTELTHGVLSTFDAHSATVTLTGTQTITVTISIEGALVRYRQSIDEGRRFNKSTLAVRWPIPKKWVSPREKASALLLKRRPSSIDWR